MIHTLNERLSPGLPVSGSAGFSSAEATAELGDQRRSIMLSLSAVAF